MKKVLMAIIVIIMLTAFMTISVFAASESENNDSMANATTISTNTYVSGNLSTKSDIDWYKFTTTSNGYFNIEFTHDFVSSSSDYWKVYLYNSTGNNIDGTTSYYGVDGNANMTTHMFGIPAGTYYVKIVKDNYSGNNYSLKVNFTASNDWETENNNSKDSANTINVNESINGSLSMNGDVDWYKFTTTSNGYFNIEFTHDFVSSSSDYWKVYLYNSTAVNNIDGTTSYYGVDGNANMTTHMFGIPAGTYYVKIVKDNYSGNNYSLKVNFTASNDWETENNNSKDSANTINVNESINGSLSMNGDVDWYTFNVSSNCEIAVTFNHEVIDSSSTYWKFYIYDNTAVTELLSYGRKGNTETATTDYISLSPGKYYIKVVKDNYSGKKYSMVVQEKHDCWGEFYVITESTCTTNGTSEKRCNICDKLIETKTIPSGHKYDEWIIDYKSTCDEYGSKYHVCSVCGYKTTEQIEKEAHVLGEWATSKDATCNDAGERIRTCLNCSFVEHENVSQLEHKYGDWIVVGGSKIIPPIVKEKTCVLCGNAERFNDWSYVWVTILAGIAIVGVLIGVFNYIKGMKRSK